jgi:hypothetical protein
MSRKNPFGHLLTTSRDEVHAMGIAAAASERNP